MARTLLSERSAAEERTRTQAATSRAIEINGTFYGSQKPASFAKWHDETFDDFVFSVKGPRFIVQKRALGDTGESMQRFDSGLAELRGKLGPILWQLRQPRNSIRSISNSFSNSCPENSTAARLRHALGVRHESFVCAQFVDLARRSNGAAIVTACDSDYPQIADATADFAYFPDHGFEREEQARLRACRSRQLGGPRGT